MVDQILSFITQQFLDGRRESDFTLESDLLTTGVIDSLGVMRLVSFLEQTFSITVPPQDVVIENFQNVGAIAAYVSTRVQNSESVVQR